MGGQPTLCPCVPTGNEWLCFTCVETHVPSTAYHLFLLCTTDEIPPGLKINPTLRNNWFAFFFPLGMLFVYLFFFSLIHPYKWYKRNADTLLPLLSPVGATLKVSNDFNEFCGWKLDTEAYLKAFNSEKRIGLYWYLVKSEDLAVIIYKSINGPFL